MEAPSGFSHLPLSWRCIIRGPVWGPVVMGESLGFIFAPWQSNQCRTSALSGLNVMD